MKRVVKSNAKYHDIFLEGVNLKGAAAGRLTYQNVGLKLYNSGTVR